MADETKLNMPPLSRYLSQLRGAVFPHTQRAPSINNKDITLVMGNPSADLDSFISAVVLSYFYNHGRRTGKNLSKSTTYVPILNLPAVRSSDLWRQRPEFAVALKAALGESIAEDPPKEMPGDVQGEGVEKVGVLERVITIANVLDDDSSLLHGSFTASPAVPQSSPPTYTKEDLILVDHNSPSIPGLNIETIKSRFNIVGCIDHHVDEGFVPNDADPRIVKTGIGSCTSLVVSHLREQGLWPEHSADPGTSDGLIQITKLALAPILIDTSNLKAKGDKCSDTDREAVRFLEAVIESNATEGSNSAGSLDVNSSQQRVQWDRRTAYKGISAAKTNSLALLSMQEAFDRDYKAFAEPITTNINISINVGISSLVKPLSWLVGHAGGVSAFVSEIETFTRNPARDLGVYGMLTRAGDGRKEAVLLATDARVHGVVDGFEKSGQEELQLATWEGEGDVTQQQELLKELAQKFGAVGIWYIGDTSKSRKQVAPLLRGVVRGL